MHKFLYFNSGATNFTDCGAMPVSLLRKMKVNSSSTGIDFIFKDVRGGIGQEVNIGVDINADKVNEVIQAVSDEIRYGKNSLIVVADDTNKQYIHPDITNAGSIYIG
jgi:hypothetical protein